MKAHSCPECGAAVTGGDSCPICGAKVGRVIEHWGRPYMAGIRSSPPRMGFAGENARLFKAGALLIVVALLTIAVSLFLPWYFWDVEHEYDDDRTFESRLELDFEGEHWVQKSRDEHGEQDDIDEKVEWGDSEDDNLDNVYRIVEGGVIFSGVLTFLALIGASIVGSGGARSSDGSRKALRWLSLLAALAMVITLGYMWMAHPTALEDDSGTSGYVGDQDGPWNDFAGSGEFDFESGDGRMEHSWGPHLGFYLAVIATILLIVSMLVMHRAIDEDEFTMYIWRRDNPEDAAREEQHYTEMPGIHADQEQAAEGWTEPTCPDCGYPIRYIDEYVAWYCDYCSKYV